VNNKQVSIRRNLEQAKHCVVEALSVVSAKENVQCAIDDIDHAIGLLREIRERLVEGK
jgi:hypothetical protein